MKVSVITITRNDKDGLRRTIESVKAQDYSDVEHIIVDADSTDGTKEFLSKAEGVSYISEPDAGRYDGMNKGAQMSRGDIIWFMHSSDIFAETSTVTNVVNQMRNQSKIYAWGYGLSAIIKDDKAIGIGGQVPFSWPQFTLGGKIVPHQASFYTKDLFQQLNGYKIDFGLAADQEFIARCALISPPIVWPHLLCIFDGHGVGSTRTLRDHFKDVQKIRRENKIVITKSAMLDSIITNAIMVETKLIRVMWRLINALSSNSGRR